MRIAIFSAQYPPHLGGIERFTQQLAHSLVVLGHEICVVTNDTESLGVPVRVEGGVQVVSLTCIPFVDGRFPLPCWSKSNSELLKVVCDFMPDAVVINARFYPHSLLGLHLASKLDIPALIIDHGSYWLSFGSPALDVCVRVYERFITGLGKKLYHPAYAGVSASSASWLQTFGIQTDIVVGNAIDASAYRAQASRRDYRMELGLPESTRLVVSVGRLIPEKGIRQIIEASRSTIWRNNNAVILIAGSGPLEDSVVQAQSQSMRFLGRLDTQDVAALFLQASFLLLPSVSEGFATTLLEAGACSLPALVTDVGGARELFGEDERFVLNSSSPEAIVAGAERLLAHDGEIASCGRELYKRVSCDYDWNSVARRVLSALEELICKQ